MQLLDCKFNDSLALEDTDIGSEKSWCQILENSTITLEKLQVLACKKTRWQAFKTAGTRLQKVKVGLSIHLDCSDPLQAVSDYSNCSETTVGNWTQWKPAVFAAKRFAVYGTLSIDLSSNVKFSNYQEKKSRLLKEI